MRERRRLALASRQLMMAQIARREAMSALAAAVEEETRTAALAERSRELMRDYGQRPQAPDAASLRDYAAFVRSLQGVAEQADEARKDASDQAQWQVRTLAAAETRATRLGDRHEAAKRELMSVIERRQQPLPQGMAHKLQNAGEEADDPRPAHRVRNRR